jgi:hypothetical protein
MPQHILLHDKKEDAWELLLGSDITALNHSGSGGGDGELTTPHQMDNFLKNSSFDLFIIDSGKSIIFLRDCQGHIVSSSNSPDQVYNTFLYLIYTFSFRKSGRVTKGDKEADYIFDTLSLLLKIKDSRITKMVREILWK